MPDVDYDVSGRIISFAASEAGGSAWLALAEVSAADTVFLDSVSVPAGGTFVWTPAMPTTPGSYEFRVFENGGYTRLATSATVTVSSTPSPLPPSIHVTATLVDGGDTVTATKEK